MSLKTRIALALTIVTLFSVFAPIQAVDYNTGAVGNIPPLQWVKYENFNASGTAVPANFTFNRTVWLTMGIGVANVTNVTLIMNGRLKSPAANLNETSIFCNLLTGETNMSLNPYKDVYNFTFIIASNLTANDPITSNSALKINSTETRAYMDEEGVLVNRTVNILSLTEGTYSNVTIYDQLTGLLMEMNITWTNFSIYFKATRTKFRAVYYNPGVEYSIPSVQWVKYENINSTVGTPGLVNLSRTVWLLVEVGRILGTNVTLILTGDINETATNEIVSLNETRIFNNLLTGSTNMSANMYRESYNFTYLMAANLTVNDPVFNGSRYKINATETRTYRDHNGNPVNRTVNILNFTTYSQYANTTFSNVTVYDKITGLLLEYNYTGADTRISFNSTRAKFDPRTPEDPTRYYYYAAIITAVVVVVAAVVIRRRRSGYVEISPEEVPKE